MFKTQRHIIAPETQTLLLAAADQISIAQTFYGAAPDIYGAFSDVNAEIKQHAESRSNIALNSNAPKSGAPVSSTFKLYKIKPTLPLQYLCQKQFIRRILAFIPIIIAKLIEKRLERFFVFRRHLYAY